MRLQRPEKNSPHAQHGLQRREKESAGRDEIQGFISRLRFLLKHRLSDSNYRKEVLSMSMECTLIFVFTPFLSSWLLVCICYAENFGRSKTGLTISSSQDSFQETSSPIIHLCLLLSHSSSFLSSFVAAAGSCRQTIHVLSCNMTIFM